MSTFCYSPRPFLRQPIALYFLIFPTAIVPLSVFVYDGVFLPILGHKLMFIRYYVFKACFLLPIIDLLLISVNYI